MPFIIAVKILFLMGTLKDIKTGEDLISNVDTEGH